MPTALTEALLTPVVLLLVLAPGIGPAVAFARRSGGDRAWALAAAFGFSVAWCSVVATSAHYLDFDLGYVVAAYAAAGVASMGWAVAQGFLHRGLPRGGRPGILLAAAAGVTAWLQGPWWFGTPDTYYHLAAARSLLATGRPLVTDPFFGTASTQIDPTAGILQTLLAVMSRLSANADVALLFRPLTAVSAGALVLAFWLLARRLAGSARVASVMAVAWVVGAWFTDLRDFGYPNKVSISLALTVIALMAWTGAERRREVTLTAAGVGFAAFAMHIAAAELIMLCGAAIGVALLVASAVSHGSESRDLRAGAGHVGVALGLMMLAAAPTLVPRLSAIQGSDLLGAGSLIRVADQVRAIAPWWRYVVPGGFDFGGTWAFLTVAVLGLLATARLRRPGAAESAATAAIALLVPVITFVPPICTWALDFSAYMVARMVEVLRFAPYAAAAWSLGLAERAERRGVRLVSALLVGAMLLSGLPYLRSTYIADPAHRRRGHLYTIREARARDLRIALGLHGMKRVREIVSSGYPVVMADAEGGYYLMGLAPVAVVASLETHTPLFIGRSEYETRLRDTEEFFTPGTTPERRAELAEQYGARYAFVYRGQLDAAKLDAELRADPRYEVLAEGDGFTFLGVR